MTGRPTERRRWFEGRASGTLRLLTALVAVEAVLVAGYLLHSEATILSVRYVFYPFVWVNLGVLAVRAADVPRPRDRRTVGAALAATLYLAVLAWTTGLVGLGSGGSLSVRLLAALPGWGPVLLVDGPVRLAVVPFEAVGYVSLAVLVYAGLARAAAGVLSGVLGLATCVSCVGPVVAGLVSGVFGGASVAAVGGAAGTYAYDLSTALFVVTVGTLWYVLRR